MAANPLKAKVKEFRGLIESLGPAARYRKLHGILTALEMQVEDGNYQRHAVTRLIEALLATRELYTLPDATAHRIETVGCGVVDLVERKR